MIITFYWSLSDVIGGFISAPSSYCDCCCCCRPASARFFWTYFNCFRWPAGICSTAPFVQPLRTALDNNIHRISYPRSDVPMWNKKHTDTFSKPQGGIVWIIQRGRSGYCCHRDETLAHVDTSLHEKEAEFNFFPTFCILNKSKPLVGQILHTDVSDVTSSVVTATCNRGTFYSLAINYHLIRRKCKCKIHIRQRTWDIDESVMVCISLQCISGVLMWTETRRLRSAHISKHFYKKTRRESKTNNTLCSLQHISQTFRSFSLSADRKLESIIGSSPD